MMQHAAYRLTLIALTLGAASACGSPDETRLEDPIGGTSISPGSVEDEIEDGVPGEAEHHRAMQPPPPLVQAELELRSGQLLVQLRNTSATPGLLSATANVMNPRGMFHTERAFELLIGAEEEAEYVLSAQEVLGLDLMRDPWSKVTINYEYELDDGQAGGDWRGIFVEDGQAVPEHPIDVVNGDSFGYPPSEQAALDEGVEKQATFRICFENEVDLFGGTQNGLDTLRAATLQQRIHGQLVDSLRAPNGSFHSVGPSARLDQGCTVPIPRSTGAWSAIVFAAATFTVGNVSVVSSPVTRQTINFNVSNGSIVNGVHVQRVRMTGTDAVALQQALVLSQFTLTRMNAYNIVDDIGTKELKLAIGTASNYTHFGNGRVRPLITLTATDASKRSTVAHETGHFIHSNIVFPATSSQFNNDYTYSNPDADDNCIRNFDGSTSHTLISVEWKAAAHIESLGHLVVALTYNDRAAAGTIGTCVWPDFGSTASCSGDSTFQTVRPDGSTTGTPFVVLKKFLKTYENDPGKPAGCAEWFSSSLFGLVGNETDWVRHYWDFFSQSPRPSLRAYFATEKSVCGALSEGQTCSTWKRDNHFEVIRTKLSAAQDAQWMSAARRNLFD